MIFLVLATILSLGLPCPLDPPAPPPITMIRPCWFRHFRMGIEENVWCQLMKYQLFVMSLLDKLKTFLNGREPWSSVYGWRLMCVRSWVWIPAPYTGWTFFTLICCKNWIAWLKRLKISKKEAGVGPFFWKKPLMIFLPFIHGLVVVHGSDLNGSAFRKIFDVTR